MILSNPFREKIQYELIGNKPHFGIILGSYAYIKTEGDNTPIVKELEAKFESLFQRYEFKGFQIREKKRIFQTPFDILTPVSSLGYKYILWGRAFEIMRLFKSKKNRYIKKIVGGRRKRIKVKKVKINNV